MYKNKNIRHNIFKINTALNTIRYRTTYTEVIFSIVNNENLSFLRRMSKR